jgi:hypothetical protein
MSICDFRMILTLNNIFVREKQCVIGEEGTEF